MKHIECKAQWLARPLRTLTGMSGFEGPAASTSTDDGFGNPMIKGRITDSYTCFFRQTGHEGGSPSYDGTIDIPDTPANRYKIAQHVRSRDLRVKDRNLEKQILADNPKMPKEARPKTRNLLADMPEDFDGTKVRLTGAMVDEDPIEDPHAEDAVFTEVPKTTPAVVAPVEPEPAQPAVIKTSAAEALAGAVAPKVTEPPKGVDPRSLKAAASKPAKTEE